MFFFLIGVPVFEPQLFCDVYVARSTCMKAPLPATFFLKTSSLIFHLRSLISLISEMHFAISILQVLHVLMSSSATQLQPEPEAGSLLQTQAQQAHLLASKAGQPISPLPPGLQSLCSGGPCLCPPYDFVVSPPPMINGVDLGECRSLCESFPAFFFMELNVDPSSYCECCETTDTGELAVDPRFITAATYEVVRGDPGTLQDLCSGENCVCDDINRDTQTFNLDSTQCANVCYLQDPPLLTFSIITFNGPEPYFDPRTGSNFLVSSVCICCNGPATEAYEFPEEGVAQTWTITPFPAGAQGDPTSPHWMDATTR